MKKMRINDVEFVREDDGQVSVIGHVLNETTGDYDAVVLSVLDTAAVDTVSDFIVFGDDLNEE